MPLILAMSTALPEEWWETLPRLACRSRGRSLQARDRRLEAGGGEELERGEHAAVDLPEAHVAAAAAVDLDARVGEDALDQRLLAHQQDLADRRALGVLAEERVLARGAVDRGRLEQLPAVEDRLRVDARGAAAGRADLEEQVRRDALGRLADAAEDRAGDDARARLERLERDVARERPFLTPKTLLKVERKTGEAARSSPCSSRICCAPPAIGGLRAERVGEQALLAVEAAAWARRSGLATVAARRLTALVARGVGAAGAASVGALSRRAA